ncbi:hypothetical protein BAJUN_00240 [Bajunvirus bajun]|uniref:Uncharacterized protein n=1 Tax=Brevundimonas phage vB_BgoS-Bajun TaxID=2948594 RepID=A0A9E7N780_9CAUD|nr:hypothetical protein BAJUN_00240 [Brevundimonas phage vB_BgoS-Bajun]
MSNHYRAALLGAALAIIGAVIFRASTVGIFPGTYIMAGISVLLAVIAVSPDKKRAA